MKNTKSLISFIEKSPSPFHVVNNFKSILDEKSFIQLHENKPFSLEWGKSYYISRNNSAIIAFTVPEKEIDKLAICAAHTDSPTFKVKPNPEVKAVNGDYTCLNVEPYGGNLLHPWFDRPLSIAGRVFLDKNGEREEVLVDFDKDLVSIVSLAIHQNRDVNNGVKLNVQKELCPLFATGFSASSFKTYLAKHLNIVDADILDYDLFLYNRNKGSIWGANDEFFSIGKIDDLACAYAAMDALINTNVNNDTLPMACLFDNEEVGSSSNQGALSDFLYNTLDRICLSLDISKEKFYMILSNSYVLSADNGHAVHPNYVEKSDITNHPALNKGVLLKYSGNLKYTTDGSTGALVKQLCKNNGIPVQVFANNSNVPGGSTLGNLSIQQVGIKTADIGLAQLAMHSPYESAGTEDLTHMINLLKAFFKN